MNPDNQQPTTPQPQPVAPPQHPQAQPQLQTTQPAGVDPGKSMAIGGIILGFVVGAPFGVAISIIAMNKSKKSGYKNTLALVFTIIFAVLTPFWIIWVLGFIAGLA